MSKKGEIMACVSVNVLSAINSTSKISKETIDGKEHFIIKDVVPVVDDVVMNGGLYPGDEIDKGYLSINGNLMPLGHPKVGSNYVSANDPKAINEFYGGAWAENVRKESGKVLLDAYVDIEFASNHKKGKLLVERLGKMINQEDVSPIHVSTGLTLNKEFKSGKSKGKSYTWVAHNMNFDHVAILLNEQGAATPDEGVGIFVNSEGEHQIEQANLNEPTESNDISQNIVNKVIQKLTAFIASNKQEEDDPMKEKILQALNAKGIKTDGLTDEQLFTAYNQETEKDVLAKKKAEDEEEAKKTKQKEDKAQNSEKTPAWAQALIQKVNSLETSITANAEAENKAMREAVKAKFSMTDTAVNALSGEPLKELYAQCQTSTAVNTAFGTNSTNTISDMPE